MKEARVKNDAKNKTAKRLLESLEVREGRLHKDAALKTTKHLLESLEVRGERLHDKNHTFHDLMKPQQIALSKFKCARGMCSTMHSCYS